MFEEELARVAGGPKRVWVRMLVLALHQLGYVPKLECMWEDCLFESRAFEQGARNPLALSIDHIINISDGGTDHLSNLRVLHFYCNSKRGGQDAMARPNARAAIGAATGKRWADDDGTFRTKMDAAAHTPEANEKRRIAMRAHWADPEKKAKHATASARGRWPKSC